MSWNYRVLRHDDGSLALHEVYYDASGKPNRYTEQPISFSVGPDETLDDLIGYNVRSRMRRVGQSWT